MWNAMKFWLATVLTFILFASAAQATNQFAEVLIYNGEVYQTSDYPLVDCDSELPDFAPLHTACYRGYIGIWQIVGNHLYLLGLKNNEKATLKTIFGTEFTGNRVAASWYSGQIEAGDAKLTVTDGIVTNSQKQNRSTVEMMANVTVRESRTTTELMRQYPDILLHDGQVLSMHTFPLERHLDRMDNRPRFYAQFWDFTTMFDSPTAERYFFVLPARSRGYTAYWEIADDKLFLLGLDGWQRNGRIGLKGIFPEAFADGRVFASWWTGVLLVSCPDRQSDVMSTPLSLFITVEKGVVQDISH